MKLLPAPGTYKGNQTISIQESINLLQIAEELLFNILWYPDSISIKGKLVPVEERDKINFEEMVERLIEYFERDPQNPIYIILKRKYRIYKYLKRTHSLNDDPKFHSRVLLRLFFYIYEAGKELTDKFRREEYLKRFL